MLGSAFGTAFGSFFLNISSIRCVTRKPPKTFTAAKATANASPEEPQAIILAMVDKLASRLESQPDDVEGWARLGRSYMVLNQPDKAKDAYARAVKLKPDDPLLNQALAEASAAAGETRTK